MSLTYISIQFGVDLSCFPVDGLPSFSSIYIMVYSFDIAAVRVVSNIDLFSSDIGADVSYDTGPMSMVLNLLLRGWWHSNGAQAFVYCNFLSERQAYLTEIARFCVLENSLSKTRVCTICGYASFLKSVFTVILCSVSVHSFVFSRFTRA